MWLSHRASISRLPTPFVRHLWQVLNANCRRNSWAKSSHVWCRDTSKEANQYWIVPLKDMWNSIIIWALSKPWTLIIVLYKLKWMWGHPIPMYRSISSILNLVGRLATSSLSKSSHTIPPSHTLTVSSSAQAYPCVHGHPPRSEQPPWQVVGQPQSNSVK